MTIKEELNSRVIWLFPDEDDLIRLCLSLVPSPSPGDSDSMCFKMGWKSVHPSTLTPSEAVDQVLPPDVSNFNSSRFCLMMLAIYIVVILECYYAFKERAREQACGDTFL